MKSHSLTGIHTFPCSLCLPNRRTIIKVTNYNHFSIHISRRFTPHRRPKTLNFQVVRCSMQENRMLEPEDAALLVSTCITRTLSPALTLEQGLERIKVAVEELKAKPPCCSSGMFRFRVAVPPSTKSLNWFCCQPESSGVFPQFFLSKEREKQIFKSLVLGHTRGIFGIGAAISFKGFSASHEYGEFGRCCAVESTPVVAYGFLNLRFDTVSSSMKQEAGSFYFFIPQIELEEFEGASILSTTVAWHSCICTFEEALQVYESSLLQAENNLCSEDRCCSNHIGATLREVYKKEGEDAQMVYAYLQKLFEKYLGPCALELKDASDYSSQFFARMSPTLAISNNMHQQNDNTQFSCRLQDCANINILWASLLIEECTRLGLTYFCVAPGSRSSPLAIAASTHPATSCIACIDERSLAFHAVGYARSSHKPAVVITSSGTAVSNLHPAVVEASQEFVPLLLLTADRPPELHDVGANQAINQVNHFGPFVRHFFNLPAPADDISARMVLTSIDSAVHIATTSPSGPVHINCPFREPLENSSRTWNPSCLRGLDSWMSTSVPFTSYIQVRQSYRCNYGTLMAEALEVIEKANRGLLLLGAIHREDDIWAALLLAKHLSWPVVVDILSGLRLRKYFVPFPEFEDGILFIDHLDHMLLSDPVRDWMKADVIIQIGSRITSKRVAQLLESCFPCSYIMVDNHPSRHDPSHIVTHRIQCAISQFADYLITACSPLVSSKWKGFLQALNTVAAWDILSLINSEHSLTEPYVAQMILEAIHCESAVFFGNSMPIRDADMYACNSAESTQDAAIFSSGLPCQWIQVAANRGASGIDGLLSTAVGFAVGCNKRVLCIVGDVSFLHDTNGLSLLRNQMLRKPMTIVVINNRGGAIFSLLPLANVTARSILDQYFYTSHDVSIHNLCLAHGVNNLKVQSKMELQDALLASQMNKEDFVIEVESTIDANAAFHSMLRKFSQQGVDRAFNRFSKLNVLNSINDGLISSKVGKMQYSKYRIQLSSPPTSSSASHISTYHREGFIISLFLEDGNTGYGEVAPLEIHKENLLDVEEQLQFLMHVVKGVAIDHFLPLLKGSFSRWLWHSLGIQPNSIFPSVRFGVEMAVLNAIAAREGSSLLNVLYQQTVESTGGSSDVKVCALLESNGGPNEMALVATTLVKEGFTAIKLKVARQADPTVDIAIIKEIRKKVGWEIELRADANRSWNYDEAVKFGLSIKDSGLQYIEEPVNDADDIIKFCEETGLPVALDETINSIRKNHLKVLAKYTHPMIVAFVIKPSVVGGFENAALLAQWAHQQGKIAVISATFESSLGLSALIQFSRYVDLLKLDTSRMLNKEESSCIAHGLGTYQWLREDVSGRPLVITCNPCSGVVEASVTHAGQVLQHFQFNHNAVVRDCTFREVHTYEFVADLEGTSICLNVQEIGKNDESNVVVFLHGFLGTGGDWISIMKAISGSARCIAVDLPGHGRSKLLGQDYGLEEPRLSIMAFANILQQLFDSLQCQKVTLVGYSLGARISLYMALKYNDKVAGAVIISGSPGLMDEEARKVRWAKDDFAACFLVSSGLEPFLGAWYSGDLWNSLRTHPHFSKTLASRLQHCDLKNLGRVLSDLSVGRQPPLWEDLKSCRVPLQFIVGEKDVKFRRIAQKMRDTMCQSTDTTNVPEIVEIPYSGHAAHIENPLPVISAISQFIRVVEIKS
ncbi:protein PHYLLO, chloroplastic isoform X1 [Nicotiana sylvestris]|uniref:Protein PHYLLO, chloroplastic isoform X1 n=3 Tax=Nicotiana sylvestris TaxID=4096 RepID=A0A1U7VST4_NICSY|nr:PREDICTED: protein PHYLLO, chloroplastic isoform X1 [Nicotiana sylvestris]